jgi:NAD(P)-dependent dehydrogenase (short-subunit alcohol dehydrogenase family)
MSFSGKVAIVTGGASGIGLAAAKRFGSEGAIVAIADIDKPKADEAAAAVIDAGAPDACGIECDVGNESAVDAAVTQIFDKFDRLDVVVNNAGLMIFKPIVEQSGDDFIRILHVDLVGAFYFIKQAFLRMKPGSAIVNVSSVHAVETQPLVSSYAAAKAALLSLTRSAALEGNPLGIRVNAVLPGAVDTPMLWDNPNVRSGVEVINPDDVGTPEEIAAAIAYLASDEASFVQGAALRVDGGRLSRL